MRAGLPGGDTVDVQAGQVQKIEEMRAAAIDVAEREFLTQSVVVYRCPGNPLFSTAPSGMIP
jgi:hypothetical protein